MNDLKVSFRLLVKSPGFTLAAIVVLALGIGLNAAMFSVLHATVFAGRAFPDADRVVQIFSHDTRTQAYRAFAYPVYAELSGRTDVFSGVLAHRPVIVGVGADAESRRSMSAVVSQNYFDVLGVAPVRGRVFTAEESTPGRAAMVAIASHAYWKRTGFAPDIIGRTVRINEHPTTIIGVMPEGFTGTMMVFGPELYFPLGAYDVLSNDVGSDGALGMRARSLSDPHSEALFVVGRLRDGVAFAAASQAVALYGQSMARALPAEYEHQMLSIGALPRLSTSTDPSDESVLGPLAAVFLGMTGAVLLTVCLNLASMLLARGRARRKEFAVRLALGGGRGRLVRQLLIEGFVLALAGGALGLALGSWGLQQLVAAFSSRIPITIGISDSVSPALAVATIFFSLAATLGFALGPALRNTRLDLLTDLKAQPGDDAAPRRWRFVPRNPLVATQVALSLCLLIAAGLFLRMALTGASTDLGYRADDTVLAEVDSQLGGFTKAHSLDLYARIEHRLSALPGAPVVSIGAVVPMGMVNYFKNVRRAGIAPPPGSKPTTPEAGQSFGVPLNAVGTSYFDAMGVRLLRGRTFTPAETFSEGAPAVSIIDEALALELWPDGSALGQRIQWASDSESGTPATPMEVVGIVASTRAGLFEKEPRGAVYVPFAQGFTGNAFFHVRPSRPDADLPTAVRREIRDAAAGLPLFNVRTFSTHMAVAPEYWALSMASAGFAFFAGMAMVVALVGLYGVTAYTVERRTREIGVRVAVGARPVEVIRLILGEGMVTTMAGIGAGWVLGLGVGRAMSSIFVDVAAFDGWTFALVPVAFVVSSAIATFVPARRAARINPVTALRAE
ncbi:MAG: ABC transporter permease [Acidobacteria bacterium]|nr:ABC transporter permease [Acidobacteriota bacterium]